MRVQAGRVRAVIESMNGARFVHDRLEELGWDVLIADAQKVKGPGAVGVQDRQDRRARVGRAVLARSGAGWRSGCPTRRSAANASSRGSLALGPASHEAQEPHPRDADHLRPPVPGLRPVRARGPRVARSPQDPRSVAQERRRRRKPAPAGAKGWLRVSICRSFRELAREFDQRRGEQICASTRQRLSDGRPGLQRSAHDGVAAPTHRRVVLPTTSHRRAGLRPDQVQPRDQTLSTPGQSRLPKRMAPDHGNAQPPEAPQPPDRRRNALSRDPGRPAGRSRPPPGRLAPRASAIHAALTRQPPSKAEVSRFHNLGTSRTGSAATAITPGRNK